MGEALPTATWRTSPINRAITSASSSSSRKWSPGAAFIHIPFEIFGKTLRRCRHAGIFRKVIVIGCVEIRQSQRPGAALRERDTFDIERRECAGGEHRIVEQIAV